MKLRIEPFNYENMNVYEILASWYNDPEIMYKIHPNFKEEKMQYVNSNDLYTNMMNSKRKEKNNYLVYDDDNFGKLIGELTFEINPPMLMINVPTSAWISICVGEKAYHGTGAAKEMMDFLEDKILKQNVSRIELGVFEFNKRAINFYNKLGYEEFTRIDDFTFFNGKWYSDIRMQKIL
jgi:RimJ/RimL family protein N-acetyltransferase